MGQENVMQLARIERETEEMEGNLQIIDTQILELEAVKATVINLAESKNEEVLSSIGGRIFIKSKIDEKEKLFVEVGAGVIVKKSPEEITEIISSQLSRLKEARNYIELQLNSHHNQIVSLYNEAQNQPETY